MPRSGAESRRRLQQATLELFQQKGFDATTAAEIAERAGVTERTFFRHFADKREALFDGEAEFREEMASAVVSAPAGMSPIEALFHAFRSAEPLLQRNRPFTEPRQKIIDATPALQERVLTKTAGLIAALADAFRKRGVEDDAAKFAAQIGIATVSHATQMWLADPNSTFAGSLMKAETALKRFST